LNVLKVGMLGRLISIVHLLRRSIFAARTSEWRSSSVMVWPNFSNEGHAMRKILTMLVAAAVIGTTLVATSGTADARWGYGWGGGWRGGWGYAGGWHGGWGYRGWGYRGWGYRGWGYPGVAGFAAGAVIGSAIAAAPYTSFPRAYYVGYGYGVYPYAPPPVYSGYGYGYGYGCGC
jgi:hypothetical protein